MAIELIAEPRSEFGKEKMKKLRADNILPGNIYGGPLAEPKAIQLDLHACEQLIQANGKSADYAVVLEGQTYPVRIEEIRYEPIYRGFLHLDFVVKTDE